MTTAFFICLLMGGGVGAGLGHFGRCQSGACPLTANWRRGALFGAAMGLLLYLSSGCSGAGTSVGLIAKGDLIQRLDSLLETNPPTAVLSRGYPVGKRNESGWQSAGLVELR